MRHNRRTILRELVPLAVMTLGGLLLFHTAATAGDEKCARCGNLASVCQAGCGHTPSTCPCKTFTADKGPDRIDKKVLDSYPKSVRETYDKLFSPRCSKCHTLARPINTELSPVRWEEYLKKMMRKPGSGIGVKEGKRVWQLLVYDTVKRKPKFVEKLPAKEKEMAQTVAQEVEKGK